MKASNDIIRIRHMLDSAREALSFIKGKSKNDLSEDRMLLLALIKELEIIGEAASKISTQYKDLHQEIPWDTIVRARNRLIHGYFSIDINIVWETVSSSLPELVKALKQTLR